MAAIAHKMDELQRLLKDKTQTIDSLRRQLDRPNRESAGDLQGKKKSSAFEMPNFREQKSKIEVLEGHFVVLLNFFYFNFFLYIYIYRM